MNFSTKTYFSIYKRWDSSTFWGEKRRVFLEPSRNVPAGYEMGLDGELFTVEPDNSPKHSSLEALQLKVEIASASIREILKILKDKSAENNGEKLNCTKEEIIALFQEFLKELPQRQFQIGLEKATDALEVLIKKKRLSLDSGYILEIESPVLPQDIQNIRKEIKAQLQFSDIPEKLRESTNIITKLLQREPTGCGTDFLYALLKVLNGNPVETLAQIPNNNAEYVFHVLASSSAGKANSLNIIKNNAFADGNDKKFTTEQLQKLISNILDQAVKKDIQGLYIHGLPGNCRTITEAVEQLKISEKASHRTDLILQQIRDSVLYAIPQKMAALAEQEQEQEPKAMPQQEEVQIGQKTPIKEDPTLNQATGVPRLTVEKYLKPSPSDTQMPPSAIDHTYTLHLHHQVDETIPAERPNPFTITDIIKRRTLAEQAINDPQIRDTVLQRLKELYINSNTEELDKQIYSILGGIITNPLQYSPQKLITNQSVRNALNLLATNNEMAAELLLLAQEIYEIEVHRQAIANEMTGKKDNPVETASLQKDLIDTRNQRTAANIKIMGLIIEKLFMGDENPLLQKIPEHINSIGEFVRESGGNKVEILDFSKKNPSGKKVSLAPVNIPA